MAYYKKGGQMDLSDRIAIETGIYIIIPLTFPIL